jgi:hypothetical protein
MEAIRLSIGKVAMEDQSLYSLEIPTINMTSKPATVAMADLVVMVAMPSLFGLQQQVGPILDTQEP